MFNFRTDLASERRDLYRKANSIENEINGIESEKEEINENINGLDYIEHMYYINSTIGGLKKYIADIRIREYLEDYL